MAKRKSRTQPVRPHESSERDQCQTPHYALDPILPYLSDKRIWEPCAGKGQLVDALRIAGKDVVATDILTGQDFFTSPPPQYWDVIVTNPPYSSKHLFIERCYALGKPWALLVPLETLGVWNAQRFMRQHGMEVMLLNRRVNFNMPRKGYGGSGANFPVVWLCWKLLPNPIVYGDVVPRPDVQLSLFEGDSYDETFTLPAAAD